MENNDMITNPINEKLKKLMDICEEEASMKVILRIHEDLNYACNMILQNPGKYDNSFIFRDGTVIKDVNPFDIITWYNKYAKILRGMDVSNENGISHIAKGE